MPMGRNRSTLTYAALGWGGVAAATFVVRAFRRRKLAQREDRIVQQGGLLPLARNVVHALETRATEEHTKDSMALEAADGTTYTWSEYYEEARAFARALLLLQQQMEGKKQAGGVAVHAFNCPRWFFSAIGALAAGWTVSGIYLTNTYEQAAHILRTSDVRVLVIEDETMLHTTYKTVFKDFPELTVVLLDPSGDFKPPPQVLSYADFVKQNATSVNLSPPGALADDSVATLVFTSGTTANPKAVELTHGSINEVCAMMHARIPLSESDVVISYLPLSHIAAMGIDLFSPIYCGARLHFADADALRGTLKDTLVRVRPTLFFGVPRVWEKMGAAMRAAASKSYSKRGSGPVLKMIGTAAKAVGAAWWSSGTSEVARCLLTVPYGFFKLLAFRKIRRGCGLDRCKLLYTGAAPLPEETMNYLKSVDMPLLEVFGMSESCGAIAVCGPQDDIRPSGACGRALALGKLEIAPDGEVLWSGKNNMQGYKGLPAATAAVLSPDTAQLHTGDLGTIDAFGYLYITGRKKDIIITAGGENVAPIPIEEAFMGLLGGAAGHVILIGDQRKFLTLLIAASEDGSMPSNASVEAAINSYNMTFAKSRAQRVQRAHVLDTHFSVENGELTPTMKVKRNVVVRKFAAEIEAMYSDEAMKLVGYTSMNIGNLGEETVA